MPISMTIKIDPKLWKSTKDFKARYRRRFKLAMNQANAAVHGQVRRNLSGPSHTLFPGNGNPFPGVLTGRMRNSIHSRIKIESDGITGITGPNVKYARRQNKLRPFMAPALQRQRDRVQDIFDQASADVAAGK